MAKKQAALVAVLVLASQALTIEGEVMARTAAGITVRNKKPKSPKMRDTFIPAADVIAIYTGEDSVTVAYRATAEYDTAIGTGGEINDFGLIEIATDDGTVEVNPTAASVGSVEVEGDADEKPAKGKKPAAKDEEADEKPAKGKKAAAKEEPEPEYEPEVGDRVAITNADEEVVKGTITAMTAKTVTIEDKAEDEHKFKWDDISIELIKAAAPAKKAAAKDEEEEAPAAKPKGKPGAAAKKGDDTDW